MHLVPLSFFDCLNYNLSNLIILSANFFSTRCSIPLHDIIKSVTALIQLDVPLLKRPTPPALILLIGFIICQIEFSYPLVLHSLIVELKNLSFISFYSQPFLEFFISCFRIPTEPLLLLSGATEIFSIPI